MKPATSLASATPSGVLLVTQDFPPDQGGIQTYCRELVGHLVTAGVPVRVLCPTPERRPPPRRWPPPPPDSGPDREGACPAPVDRIGIHGSFLFAPLALRIGRYLAAHPEIRTIVYAQWQSALWELLRPTLARRYQRLCLVHGRELISTVFSPLTRVLARRVLGRMDEVLPVSSEVARMVQQLPLRGSARVRLVPPGVDARRFRPVDARDLRSQLGLDGARVILSLSRLVKRKNVDGLIRAFARVHARFPDSVLLIAGEGPERERLEDEALRLPVTADSRFPVRFLGSIPSDRLAAHYSLADLFVLPGRQQRRDVEGFGITLLEAAACERPVIAGRAGGMVDAVADGETGLLVDAGSEEALAEAITRLLESPEQARRMGRAGRARVLRELTWGHCAQRIRQGFGAAQLRDVNDVVAYDLA